MKKEIKKFLSKLLPSGYFKERIKLVIYRMNKAKNVDFDVIKNENDKIVFKTNYNDLTFYTIEGLYTIVADFDYYQHFYKVKEGDFVIDAGANVGNIALLFSKKVGENGMVFCFEPDQYNIDFLNESFRLNPDLPKNWKVYDLLLWNENTQLDFQEAGTVGSSAVWFSDQANLVKKEAVTIDSWSQLQHLERLDFIKMDIEGAEIEALEGCIEIIEKFKPNFAIASYHIVNNEPTYIKLEQFFEKIGYPYKTITFRGNEIITFAGPTIQK